MLLTTAVCQILALLAAIAQLALAAGLLDFVQKEEKEIEAIEDEVEK